MSIPTITLNNGVEMPQLGYGVFLVPDDVVTDAVLTAFECGYRSVDTASAYGNESGVGRAIALAGIPRSELFITTKLWNEDHGFDQSMRAFDASLKRLGLDYVDLYLIHWPVPARHLYPDSWRALCRLLEDGRVRAIGVSNFEPAHLDRLISHTAVVPAVNQVELHPYFPQAPLRAFNAEHGILTEAWNPLAPRTSLLSDPLIVDIARRHERTGAQVVLRWHLQLGNAVIPKSTTPARIEENLGACDFALSSSDMELISGLARPERTGPDPETFYIP